MRVQCVSKHPSHRDHIYNTGMWQHEQVKDVPDDVARKMLLHRDVYVVPIKIPKGKIEEVIINNHEEELIRDMHSKIALFTPEQARNFIERNYNQKVDLRSFKKDGDIQRHALMLYDQYGGD